MTARSRACVNLTFVGHVDHGKSTVVGRMLADSGALPDGKMEAIQESCRRNSKTFEYAYLLDALKEEQAQGITIDAARCFFSTENRDYIIIDTPGHIEFLKNMVTGASRADAAIIVIDAEEGIRENSKRHGYLLSMLGIKQIIVAINKMDLVEYSESKFTDLVQEYKQFLKKIDVVPEVFIPMSGTQGDNICSLSENMPWYDGPVLLESIESLAIVASSDKGPFRMPVQDVYKFTGQGDQRRIIAGTIESGTLNTGDEIIFLPSGKRTIVETIESFNEPLKTSVSAPAAVGFTLKEQIFIKRGQMAVVSGEKEPFCSSEFRANIFWLGKSSLSTGKQYILKLGTIKIEVRLKKIIRVLDASSLEIKEQDSVQRHDVAECVLKTASTIAFDLPDVSINTSRFALIDGYDIAGGGIILESIKDGYSHLRTEVRDRNKKWFTSSISQSERAFRFHQKPSLVIISGKKDSGKKPLAKALEKRLFMEGYMPYFIPIGNVHYGLDSDIRSGKKEKFRKEELRRTAEVINILLDTGMIIIVTAMNLTPEELDLFKIIINPNKQISIWVGNNINSSYEHSIIDTSIEESIDIIMHELVYNRIIK